MATRNFGRMLYDLSKREPLAAKSADDRRVTTAARRQRPTPRMATVPMRPRSWRRIAAIGISLLLLVGVCFVPRHRATNDAAYEPPSRAVPEVTPTSMRFEVVEVAPVDRPNEPLPTTVVESVERPVVRSTTTSPPNRSARKNRVVSSQMFPSRTQLVRELEYLARDVGELPLLLRNSAPKTPGTTRPVEFVASHKVEELLKARPDLAGLSFVGDDACLVETARVSTMQGLSREFRLTKSRRLVVASSASVDDFVDIRAWMRDVPRRWKLSKSVPTLVQMLQVEDDAVRMDLVEQLATVEGSEASRALVDRAVFDLSYDVRNAANAALAKRPLGEFRDRLLAGFTHPWSEAAWHAAETCAKLNDASLIDSLNKLVDAPDPAKPYREADGRWVRTELVRMNHLGNCTVCHAKVPPAKTPPTAADRRTGGIVAPVPKYGLPLPVVYYQDIPSGGEVVRADIVYLQQDFSVVHLTSAFNPWPVEQRYDYLLQTRRLNEPEIAEAKVEEALAARRTAVSFPQREAVLAALSWLRE